MATLNIPNSFSAGTPAVASQVNSNFAAVKAFVEAISSGTNIDAGAVTASKLAADATNLFVPVGGLVPFAGASAPAGGKWMLADGAAVSRTTYSALFALVGTTYGVGDGSTTFNLPNLKGRVVVGLDGAQVEFDALGELGGDKAGVAAHVHSVTGGVTVNGNTTGITVDVLPSGGHAHTASSAGTGSHDHPQTVESTSVTGDVHTHGTTGTAGNPDSTNSTGTDYTGSAGYHSHGITVDAVGDHDHGVSVADAGHIHSASHNIGVASAGTSAGNLQPYIVLNYIIRVV